MNRRRPAVATIAVVAAVACAAPALAVQTATFGLTAEGSRTRIVHAADGHTAHDAVLVYNRTLHPLTVDLAVIGVTARPNRTFVLGGTGAGFAPRVHLAETELTLPPRGHRLVGLSIDTPTHLAGSDFAAITGQVAPSPSAGVAVNERLAVLIQVTPGHGGGNGSRDAVIGAAAGALILAAAAWLWRRRRDLSFRHAPGP
jgi:hypothetical protein